MGSLGFATPEKASQTPKLWAQSLRTVVRLMLTTNNPVFVFWGPQHIWL